MNAIKSFGLLLCLVFLTQTVSAQFSYNTQRYYRSTTSVLVRKHVNRTILRGSINRRYRSRTARKKGLKKRPLPKIAKGVSSYRRNGYILPAKFLQSFKGDNNQKRQFIALLTSYLKSYEATARKDGFPSNDLAYAFEYFTVHNYAAYHHLFDNNKRQRRYKNNGKLETEKEYKERLNTNITNSVERKIYSQFRTFMSSDAKIKQMTNEQKQLMTELLATMAKMTWVVYNQGFQSGNGNKFKEARQMAKSNLEKLFGVSVEKIKINNQGLYFVD